MQTAIINVNGEILNFNQAKISVFDRGFLYGDSLYEVVRSYNGVFFLLEEHLERLENSAALCRMDLVRPKSFFQDEIERTFRAFREDLNGRTPNGKMVDAYCRLIVTRGVGRLGFALSDLPVPPPYVIIMIPVQTPPEDVLQRGYHLKFASRLRNDRRALDPAMKSGNYLNSLLAYLEARTAAPNAPKGATYDDALMCNSEGFVAEGTTFNIFYLRRGIIATPPLEAGILDGVTRRRVIALAKNLGIPVREVNFTQKMLLQADEVFLTSTLREVFPVTKIDSKPIGSGKPGQVTLSLRQAYQRQLPN